MERLWSPWRLAYVTGATGEQHRRASSASRRPIRPRRRWSWFAAARRFVILNLYPYNNGHLMVVPEPPRRAAWRRSRADELAELMRFTRDAEIALTEAYPPQGINVGINLGAPAGAGIARPPPRPPRAALERRHQLHVRDRRHPRAAGGSERDRDAGCGRSSNAWLRADDA